MGPMPTRFSWISGMTYPVFGKSAGRCGKARSHDADDFCSTPAAVPTCIFGAVWSMLDIGASGVRYMLLVPESTMAVRQLSSLRWAG